MRMDDNSIFELSSVVQKDLLLFNDVKAPISLDEFDILLQIVCDVFWLIKVGGCYVFIVGWWIVDGWGLTVAG